MRSSRLLPAMVLVTLALGCQTSPFKGDVYYDANIDFAAFQTYAPEEREPPADARAAGNRAAALAEIEKVLGRKGLKRAAPGQADLVLKWDLGRQRKMALSGRSGGGENAGMSIEFRNVAGDTIWRGWAARTWRDSMDPKPAIVTAVDLILADFPPSP